MTKRTGRHLAIYNQTPVVLTDGAETGLFVDQNGNLLVGSQNQLVTVSYDAIAADESGATTDVYQYKTGGLAGTTVATVTVTYTSSAKTSLQSVVRS